MEGLLEELGEDDSLLIHYSGHGYRNPRTGVGYWIPHDASLDQFARTNWLNNADIRGVIASAKCRHVLLISDSWFSGEILETTRGGTAAHSSKYYLNAWQYPSRQALTAGASEAVPDKSWFAFHLRQFLQTNQHPYVDPEDIHAYVKRGIRDQIPLLGAFKDAGHVRGGSYLFFLRPPGADVDAAAWERMRQDVARREEEQAERRTGEARARQKAKENAHKQFLAQAQEQLVLVKKCDAAAYFTGEEKANLWQTYLKDFAATGHQVPYARERLAYWQAYKPESPIESAETPPGKTWTNPKDGSEMAYVPPGPFQMGSDGGEEDERPAHSVHVAGFYIGKHEVTNREFKKFLDDNPELRKGQFDAKCHDGDYLKRWANDSCPANEADHPVVCVSWFAAKAYCAWAGGRLPTEAEWEKACRAGTATRYGFGDQVKMGGFIGLGAKDVLGDHAWHSGNSGSSAHPVGQKRPNEWGVHDMHGNVWEWCSSKLQPYPYAEGDGREDLRDTSSDRVVRGGSWSVGAGLCRSANRASAPPTSCGLGVRGFRVVVPTKTAR